MKTLILFLMLSASIYAQDSTVIKFDYVKDAEQRLANNLNNIEIITIVCEDTTMRGKTFKLITTEYKNGELVKTDDYDMSCEDKVDEFMMNGEKYEHRFNNCDRIRFKEKDKEFKFTIALKQVGDSSHIIISYPALRFNTTYSSKPDYDLRVALSKTGEMYKVPIGKITPILTYNPPYEVEGGEMLWFCILDTEDPGKWYKNYNINHFYIISLLVE